MQFLSTCQSEVLDRHSIACNYLHQSLWHLFNKASDCLVREIVSTILDDAPELEGFRILLLHPAHHDAPNGFSDIQIWRMRRPVEEFHVQISEGLYVVPAYVRTGVVLLESPVVVTAGSIGRRTQR